MQARAETGLPVGLDTRLLYRAMMSRARRKHDCEQWAADPALSAQDRRSVESAVKTLQAAVRRALHRFTGDGETHVQGPRIENQRDDHADTFGVSVVRMDFVCRYRNQEGV